MHLRTIVAIVLTALLGQACLLVDLRPLGKPDAVQRDDLPKLKSLDGDRVYSFLGPDAIPALDAPRFVTVAEADFMDQDEDVIGVVHGGVAKAYSLWHLDRHEVVNDWLGGEPVAVTW